MQCFSLFIIIEESYLQTFLHSLVKNHPMIDGNKRLGTHIMLVFLALNGYELIYTQQELSTTILSLASGDTTAKDLLDWIISHQK